MESITEKDVNFIETIASKVIFTDAGDYNIGKYLPFCGKDYIKGMKAYFQPVDVGRINNEINIYGNLKKMADADRDQAANIEDFKSILPIVAKELRRHPVIMAFYKGLIKGSTAKYEDSKLTYNDFATDNSGIDFNWEFSREIHVEKLELAVCSGAVFGNMDTKELKNTEKNLKELMFYGKPIGFKEACSQMYDDASKEINNPIKPSMQEKRKTIFAKAVFDRILEGNVNHMDYFYLR